MRTSLSQLALVASLTLPAITALPTISVKGAKFFADGQQFFIKGIAYQGTPADPLVDTAQCTSDAESMASIGTNSIRVYHVDPDADHDGCMSVFEQNGIYIWLDLDTFPTAIVQSNPMWTESQFGNFSQVMDVFQKYDNLAGFWVGNEVINEVDGSIAAPYIKAAAADMKSYISAKNYRTIPIGYSAADIAELRPELQNYLACGSDYSQSIDFYGLNAYEWCGAATYTTSGYSNLQAMAEGYSIPIFFSETGCNVGGERTFADQGAIFGPNMVGTWSGSIIYEWVQEANDYGLVNYPNGEIYSGAPIPIQPDYDNLAGQWTNINPSGVAEGSYSPSFYAPACPGPSNGWLINGNVPLPTLGSAIVQAEAASIKPTPSPSSSSAPITSSSKSTTSSSSSTGSSTSSKSSKTSDPAPYTSLSSFSSIAYHPSRPFTGSMALYTMSSGSVPVETMTLIIPKDKKDRKKYTYDTVTTGFLTTSTSYRGLGVLRTDRYTSTIWSISVITGPSYVRLVDWPMETESSINQTASATAADDSSPTTTSSSSAATTSKGAGSSLGVPAGIAGAVLGLLVMVFL